MNTHEAPNLFITPSAMKKKLCNKCGKQKAIHSFAKDERYRDGYMSMCKKCRKEYVKNWAANQPTKKCNFAGCVNNAVKGRCKCATHQAKRKTTMDLPSFEGKEKHYADKIIEYPESPTGKAYIGVAKRPLMPVKGEHGYWGLLVQTDDRQLVQCHKCGQWMKSLSPMHVKSCVGMTAREYKKCYGLNLTSGLVSDAFSLATTKTFLEGRKKPIYKWTKEARRKRAEARKGKPLKKQFAEQNKKGTCPAQLKYRTMEFIRVNKELPRAHNRGKRIAALLVDRFGGTRYAFKQYGLPYPTKIGRCNHYIFPDGSVLRFDLTRIEERELFYQMMLKQCPQITECCM